MAQSVLVFIKQQIREAESELAQYQPREMNWADRSRASSAKLIPWLEKAAPELKSYVEEVLNAPVNLRELWKQVRNQSNAA